MCSCTCREVNKQVHPFLEFRVYGHQTWQVVKFPRVDNGKNMSWSWLAAGANTDRCEFRSRLHLRLLDAILHFNSNYNIVKNKKLHKKIEKKYYIQKLRMKKIDSGSEV